MVETDTLRRSGEALLATYRAHTGPSPEAVLRLAAALQADIAVQAREFEAAAPAGAAAEADAARADARASRVVDLATRADTRAGRVVDFATRVRARRGWALGVGLLAAAAIAALALRSAPTQRHARNEDPAAAFHLEPGAQAPARARGGSRAPEVAAPPPVDATVPGADAAPGSSARASEAAAGLVGVRRAAGDGSVGLRGAEAGAAENASVGSRGAEAGAAENEGGPRAEDASGSRASGPSLAAEMQRMRPAQLALGAGDPVRALALLDGYFQAFPDGRLHEEYLALRAIALCGAGPRPAGRVEAAAFLRERPRSMFAERVRGACEPR